MITLGVASLPQRSSSLIRVLRSFTNQVDKAYVVLNGYLEIPNWHTEFPHFEFILADNSKGDAMKFYGADKTDGYYFTIDDDLLVSPGYVKYMISKVDQYNGLVSFHGKDYRTPPRTYRDWMRNYRCLDEVTADMRVNFVGSGCCAFHTSRLKISIDQYTRPNMADIFTSKIATEQGVPIYVIKHRKGCMQYLSPPQGTTIWEMTKDYTHQLEIMNSFLK